jgi:hypothetical protein
MSPEFPLARSEALITEELDGQLLIYDTKTSAAHGLDANAAELWRACDGHTDIEELAVRCGVSEDRVEDTLARLSEIGLLDGDTRRSAMRKMAVGAGVAITIPTISSILVPTAAAAASPPPCLPGGSCTSDAALCCSGEAVRCGTCGPQGGLQCVIEAKNARRT